MIVLAAMVLLTVSCVQLLQGRPPLLPFDAVAAQASALSLDAVPVLIGGGVLVVLGLVLLLCAWLPGTPDVFPLTDRPGRVIAGVTRRTLRTDLNAAAAGIDGISGATTTVTPGRVRATARTELHDTTGLADQVRAAVGERLAAVGLQRPPRIAVRIARTRSTR